MFSVSFDALLYLSGELAGGGENECTNGSLPAWFVLHEKLDHGQGEPGGFAGACLGGGDHVSSGEDGGDGLCLDRGRNCVTLVGYGLKNFLGKSEIVE